MLSVGKILKPHGIKGELKVESYMDSAESFLPIKHVKIKNTTYTIKKVRVSGGFVYLFFDGIDNMDMAEKLRSCEIFAERTELPDLPIDRYYICDLIGCSVSDGDKVYGKIKDVLNYGSADIVVLSKQGKEISFPWIKEVEKSIDIDAKLFLVNKDKFQEVVVYED